MKPVSLLCSVIFALHYVGASEPVPPGWSMESPRQEIRPAFEWLPGGGPDGQGALVIAADDREGLTGSWVRRRPVRGGQHYRFTVDRQVERLRLPRRAAIPRIIWLDETGNRVLRAEPTFSSYRPGQPPRAEPEFPSSRELETGWTRFDGTYQAPPDARQAQIELHFRWGSPYSKVTWSMPKWQAVEPPRQRIVRLAAIHYQPRDGQTRREKCEQFAPLIAQAADRNADLIVLPETLTYYGTKGSYADAAEPIPGPSTEYFGSLAKQHETHIVAGLIERDGHLIYNVAVLLGPDGRLIGKYRKVTLPRGEIEGGITPGDTYPVFDTRFGKVGMMICYDGFFPEVARELANRGAEVIAWPVWGCNPMLAAARACENHVYVVSSTYTDFQNDWMLSAVYGHDGKTLAVAEQFGQIAIAEVNLDKPMYWHSLGDFQSQIQPHRPAIQPTP